VPLADDLSRRLVSSRYLCKAVGVILITSELKIKSRTRTLDSPTDSESEILRIASEMFDSFFGHEKSSFIRRVGIRVSNFTKSTDSESCTLFDYL
jgi:nucleotidyltransferase/DNA polymerase involved in DNA repair